MRRLPLFLLLTLCTVAGARVSADAELSQAWPQLLRAAGSVSSTLFVPTKPTLTTASDPLPPILEAVLKSLPAGYSNKERSTEVITMGELAVRNASWLIEPETQLRFSVIDFWANWAWGIYLDHLEFRDIATLNRLRPWLLLSLGKSTAFQKDGELLVMTSQDPRIDWVQPVVEKLGYRKVPELKCSEQTERILSRQSLTLAPNEEKELTMTFAKELMAIKVQLVAVAQEGAPNKLFAVLSNPGINKDLISINENEDWLSEKWHSAWITALFPAQGEWKLKFKNNSLFTSAQINGWGVEVVGYSLNSCTDKP